MIPKGGRSASSPLLLAVLAFAIGWTEAPSPPFSAPLDVEVAGCSAIARGPVCELPDDGKLRLWIGVQDAARVAIHVDEAALPANGERVQGGLAVPVQVSAGAREIVVTAQGGGARRAFRIALQAAKELPAVKAAQALQQKGDAEGAERVLADSLKDADPAVRAAALAQLARIDIARKRTDDAFARFRAAADLYADAGRISDEVNTRVVLSYQLVYNGRRFAEARAVLPPVASARDYAEGPAWIAYGEGVIAYEAADLRAALQPLREAGQRAVRLGAQAVRLAALQVEADTLRMLGRDAEGESLFREASATLPSSADACSRAELYNNLGWFALGARGTARTDPREIFAPLERSLAIYREGTCRKPWGRANVLTNLALAKVEAGDAAAARADLAAAREAAMGSEHARLSVHWQDCDGRIDLEGDRPEAALAAYERLGSIAAAGRLPVAAWRAALGRALSLERLGRVEGAREAYARAEEILDDHSLVAPVGEGRETFLGRFDESAKHRVRFLLAIDPRAAARAARRARARELTTLGVADRVGGLDAEDRKAWEASLALYRGEREALAKEAARDWQLSARELEEARLARKKRQERAAAELEHALATLGGVSARALGEAELAEPEEGELFLVYHPLPAGWAGFAVTRDGVVARDLGPVDRAAPADELSGILLEPFRAEILAARRIRVLASGALDQLDVHALPWDERPLLALAPVVYGVDVLAARVGAAVMGPEALVVSDPRSDLPAARREAQALVTRLRETPGLHVRLLEGPTATHAAFRAAIESPSIELLHYAGHGTFTGHDGWDSGISLADGASVTVGDVLALARVPRRVVLSGCETARTAGGAPAGLGLGQAFVLAGAEAVVAATRPVDDVLTARLMAAFYGAGAGAPHDAAARLREAELAAFADAPASDWSSFRVLVP